MEDALFGLRVGLGLAVFGATRIFCAGSSLLFLLTTAQAGLKIALGRKNGNGSLSIHIMFLALPTFFVEVR
jgi:hypothetical protein